MPFKLVPPRRGKSPNYRIRGTITAGDKSKYIDETTGVAIRELADAIRIKREEAILQELVFGARASRTFAEAAVTYIETKKPGSRQRDALIGYQRRDGTVGLNLVDEIGGILCSTIDQNTLDEIARRRFAGVKPGTLVRSLIGPVTAVLNFAAKRKWCDRPQFERPEFDDEREVWIEPDAAARLLAAAYHLRPLLLFLLLTGARLSEALRLEWEDVDLSERWMVLRRTKQKKKGADQPGESRGVPIYPQVLIALVNLPTGANGTRRGRVFLTPRGRPYAIPRHQGGGQVKTAWGNLRRRAGFTDLRVHDLRHTFATWLRRTGCDERLQDEIMGHRSTKMGRRYAHVVRPELIEAIDKIPPLSLSDEMPVRRVGRRRASA